MKEHRKKFIDIEYPKTIKINGIVLPKEWNEKGDIESIGIFTFDEEEYLVEKDKTGKQFHTIYCSIGLIIGFPLLAAIFTGFPISWAPPELKGFNFVGGIHFIPEFIALWIALTVYHSAYIAEIVRGGLQAIGRSQYEAAYSLGCRPKLTMIFIIIPQALRIIIPPLGNTHLSIFKDSSLAAAIGYPDLMLIFAGTVLSQTGQALEVMGIVMAVYLTVCLTISFLINLYNRRKLLVEE